MGIISDILEDTKEQYGQFIDTITPPVKTTKDGVESLHFFECPLCNQILTSEADLKLHVNANHANKYVYVRLNGQVISDYIYLRDKINSCEVILLGGGIANVLIKANDLVRHIQFSTKVDISNVIKTIHEGQIDLRVNFSSLNRNFTIYLKSLPHFENQTIDKTAFELLFLPLHKKGKPNYTGFSSMFLQRDGTLPEFRYASGLYDYALAFDLAGRGNQAAKEHFENAFSKLSPFRTNTAMTARRVLSLRMNSFSLLKLCGQRSRFWAANIFFNNPYNTELTSIEPLKDISTYEFGVYIDEFTGFLLEAINSYYSKDFEILYSYCEKLGGLITGIDQNNNDKLLLLRARAAKKQGKMKEAEDYYSLLINHPDFMVEAREMIK